MRLNTTYFGPISWYKQLACAAKPLVIDDTERFVKQTDRTRCRIAAPNGVQMLSVPVRYSNGDNVREVRISDHNNWRHLHWQALSTAYGSSPFFEFYEDDIRPFFQPDWEYLYDYNNDIMLKMCELIGIDTTKEARPCTRTEYYQVFKNRHGFLPDLSILDLLFNMGPESLLWIVASSVSHTPQPIPNSPHNQTLIPNPNL